MTETKTTAHFVLDVPNRTDEDGRVMIRPRSNRPLPRAVFEDRVIIADTEGAVYLVDVLDFHDCWMDGGEPSYVWVELR